MTDHSATVAGVSPAPGARLEPDAIGAAQDTIIGMASSAPAATVGLTGLAYDYVAARITLRIGSALTDVGLTALFSRTLADAGISCNVIAGLAHDHLFVGWDQGARALALLCEL